MDKRRENVNQAIDTVWIVTRNGDVDAVFDSREGAEEHKRAVGGWNLWKIVEREVKKSFSQGPILPTPLVIGDPSLIPLRGEKPHKGKIESWQRKECERGLGYYITGRFVDHPQFAGEWGHTSWVEKHDGQEIETRNSRYTLVGEEQ